MESAVVRLPLPRRQSPALLPTALWVDPGPLVVSKSLIVWCCCPDSNGGPTDYESASRSAVFRGEAQIFATNSRPDNPLEPAFRRERLFSLWHGLCDSLARIERSAVSSAAQCDCTAAKPG